MAVQAIGFLTGIVVIRMLSMEQYAFYTLANTMLGTMAILANAGTSTGVMVEGSQVYKDPKKLGAILSSGLHLRKMAAIWSFAISAPLLLFLLLRNGAPWPVALLIVGCLVPAFISALSAGILEIPLRLHQAVLRLQKVHLGVAGLRLLTTGPVLLLWPAAAPALLVTGATQIYANLRLRRLVAPFALPRQALDPDALRRMAKLLWRMMPNAIYFCFASQIAVWMVSIFGSVVAIAQVGALSRIGLALAVVQSLIVMIVVPRFARLPSDPRLLVRRFVQVQCFICAVIGVGGVGVYMMADLLLGLLGSAYQELDHELYMMTASVFAGLAAFAAGRMNEARGWIISPWIFIPVCLTLQISLAMYLKPTTTMLVFTFSAIFWIGLYIVYNIQFISSIRRLFYTQNQTV